MVNVEENDTDVKLMVEGHMFQVKRSHCSIRKEDRVGEAISKLAGTAKNVIGLSIDIYAT